MGTKLYVGNLPFNTTENELQELFSQAGAVQEVTLMQDRFTGKSRGFAFVTMGTDEEAQNAISKFNGHTMDGRPMTVNEARPREQRPPGGGGGGGGGGRYGGGGYGGPGGGGPRKRCDLGKRRSFTNRRADPRPTGVRAAPVCVPGLW